MTPLIELNHIVKNYRRMRALDDVTAVIQPGVTGLLGPNGAGKSTLIKVILGLVKVTSGSGTVMGLELGKHGRAIRARIGYMPEDDCYIPGLQGVEVVQFAACLSGLPRVEALRRAHEILDFCGMKQERYREIETFSTGMRQKVKFAAAIVHDPELLILDEPTAGLDPEERESLLNRIRLLARNENKSVLISTHILPDVQSICDHALILARGRVRLNRTIEELSRPTAPTLSIRFMGDAESFARALQSRGIELERDLNSADWLVRGSDDDLAPVLWQVAADCGIALQSVKPARNSLEEIFVSAVEEATSAHS